MTPLFSATGQRRLDAIVQPGLLCVFDFDGTLSPIVPDPDAARLPADMLQRLNILSDYAPVGILTGRSIADARSRIDFKADFIVGNHGIEGMPGWERRAERYIDVCRGWRSAIDTALSDDTWSDSGLMIEDKRYSLSVHYRKARDPAHAAARLSALFATLSPLPRVIAGKCVFNLLPDDAADKGSALAQLIDISVAKTALYVGDDVTDEHAFRLRRPDLLTIRIESLAESAADFYLERREDMVQFLDELSRRLKSAQGRNWRRSGAVG
jgi:trehalose 6-phosphate phosphatase